METSDKTARQLYMELRSDPSRLRYTFGKRPMLVNVDLQCAYTQVGMSPTAYETDPNQIVYVNQIARELRRHRLPVVWTYVAYHISGADCGVHGSRDDQPFSLQNLKHGSERAALDPRAEVDDADFVINKRMPSAFFETHLTSLATFHGIDTVIVTGGSTSGCVRATVVDSISRGFRTFVPEECVADLHESRHFASLDDMMRKYAEVLPVGDILELVCDLP
ncbi:isochorismatase family protein [Devosia sp. A369]